MTRAISLDGVPEVSPSQALCAGCQAEISADRQICDACLANLTRHLVPPKTDTFLDPDYMTSTTVPVVFSSSIALQAQDEPVSAADAETSIRSAAQHLAESLNANITAAFSDFATQTQQASLSLETWAKAIGKVGLARPPVSECSVFRPSDSYLDTCKCGWNRAAHSRQQVEAWLASLNMLGRRK